MPLVVGYKGDAGWHGSDANNRRNLQHERRGPERDEYECDRDGRLKHKDDKRAPQGAYARTRGAHVPLLLLRLACLKDHLAALISRRPVAA